MATLKHIKSRNANYSDAIEYLLFQHNEGNMKQILDDMGRKILRDEFYMDGLNCDAMSFDKECELTNKHFHKNHQRSEIKSHHYIISFDPKDVSKCGLTGAKAHALCLDYAKKIFPGYQALVVTHTDGHNGSGNIHTHIVINSVRKYSVERESYMDQPHDHEAGYKHRTTKKLLRYLQKKVMEMCEREGLHQVDLLSPAAKKITQQEYMAQRHGQKKLNEINEKIVKDGLTPTTTIFQTQKQFLRDAIDQCAPLANSFGEFQNLLLEKYNVSVIESRGRYRYLHPDRKQRITEKALGAHYGKAYLEKVFENIEINNSESKHQTHQTSVDDYHSNPLAILHYKSHLRLVINLQTNVKAMQNDAYARKVKISNLQQMANTIIFVQENGFDTTEDLKKSLTDIQEQMNKVTDSLSSLTESINTVNAQIHFTGQYQANKRIYSAFLKSQNKAHFRKEHGAEILAYEEAREWLKAFYPDGKMLSLNVLKEKKEKLSAQRKEIKHQVQSLQKFYKNLDTANTNVNEILQKTSLKKAHTAEHIL